MQLSRLAQLFGLLCWLISVDSALVMTSINATIAVKKSKIALGPEYKMKKVSSLSVSCRLSDTTPLSSPKVTWQKLGQPGSSPSVTATVSGDGLSIESKHTVENLYRANVSAYVCTGQSGSQSASATVAFLSVPLLGVSVSGGGGVTDQWAIAEYPDLVVQPNVAVTVTCEVSGFPTSVVHWLKDVAGTETPIGDGPKLQFSSSSYERDRGYYVCRATNAIGSNSLRIFLRVKNPKAYLTPLILLVILVAVVVVIFVIYELSLREKRQRAARALSNADRLPKISM